MCTELQEVFQAGSLPSAFWLSHFSFLLSFFSGSGDFSRVLVPSLVYAWHTWLSCKPGCQCPKWQMLFRCELWAEHGGGGCCPFTACPVMVACRLGRDRKAGLKIKLKYVDASRWMYAFGTAAALPSLGGVRHRPSENGISFCYPEESLVHNILD